jgi:DTW domain-containing protein YfiP
MLPSIRPAGPNRLPLGIAQAATADTELTHHSFTMDEQPAGGDVEIMISGSEPIDNRLFVLILQHPQEKKETLGTAAATVSALRRSALVVGLSWPNLSRALGRPADPKHWAVAYLGSVRPAALAAGREIVVVDRRGVAVRDQGSCLRGLEGVVLLDGSWSEAKALWWRNPWLLKLHRLVLDPARPSAYRPVRRAARREALATIEAAGLLLRHLDAGPALEAGLDTHLARLLTAANSARASA